MSNPEVFKGNESTGELEAAAGEQLEKLRAKQETAGEKSPESNGEQLSSARKETLEVFAREAGKERSHGGEPSGPSPRAIRKVTRQEKAVSYRKTMSQVQREMSPSARTFSKVIHTPAVEKTSQAVGNTVARPNAILAGSIFAFVFVLATYLVARYYGYPLSGFETIGAFTLGWIVGLIYDYASLMFRSRSS